MPLPLITDRTKLLDFFVLTADDQLQDRFQVPTAQGHMAEGGGGVHRGGDHRGCVALSVFPAEKSLKYPWAWGFQIGLNLFFSFCPCWTPKNGGVSAVIL